MKKILYPSLILLLLPVLSLSAQAVPKPRDFTGVWIPEATDRIVVRKGILKIEITPEAKELAILVHHTVGGKIILTKGLGREENGKLQVTWLPGQENLPPVSALWYGDEVGNLVVGGQAFFRASDKDLTQIP